jgi:hypothetical protein
MERTVLLMLLIVSLSACSIEKRVHRSGFAVSWKSSPKVTKSEKEDLSYKTSMTSMGPEENIFDGHSLASYDDLSDYEAALFSENSIVSETRKNKSDDRPCDFVIFHDGTEIEAVVMEISETEIKYKLCNNQGGPLYSVSKSKIFMIKYSNGTKEVYEKKTTNSGNESKNSQEQRAESGKNRKFEFSGLIGFIAALTGIILYALTFNFIFLGIGGIFGLVFGIISVKKVRKSKVRGDVEYFLTGFGVASLIMGSIFTAAFILGLILPFVL